LAFRKAMLVHHPDVSGGDDSQARALLAAYNELRGRKEGQAGTAFRVNERLRRGFYDQLQAQVPVLEKELWSDVDVLCASEEECAAYAEAWEQALVERAARRAESAAKRVAFTRGAEADAQRVLFAGQQAAVMGVATCLAVLVMSQRVVVPEQSMEARERCYSHGGGLCRFL
jgi:hypothetical protein